MVSGTFRRCPTDHALIESIRLGMPRIVISYSHTDRAAAEALARLLHRAGNSVWFDQSLLPGDEYTHEIDAQIRGADALVVLWSASSVESSWVRNEAALAKDLGILVPVKIEPCTPKVPFYDMHPLNVSWNSALGCFEGAQTLLTAVRAWPESRRNRSGIAGKVAITALELSSKPGALVVIRALRLTSIEELKKAAQTNPVAQWLVGTALLEGIGVTQNFTEAESYLERAANAGVSRAWNSLAHLCLERNGSDSEKAMAVALTKRAADAGVAIAQYSYAGWLARGHIVTKNIVAAFQMYHRAALGGSADAQNELGWCFYKGEGTRKDLTEARYWFERAAGDGQSESMAMLGALAADGLLPGQGDADAAEQFKAAFVAGNRGAAMALGDLLASEKRDVFDPVEAAAWYKRAGEAGEPRGFFSYAQLVQQGKIIATDPGDVRMCLAHAADLGYGPAAILLAEMWERGEYGPQDTEGALDAYKHAASGSGFDSVTKARASAALARLSGGCGAGFATSS